MDDESSKVREGTTNSPPVPTPRTPPRIETTPARYSEIGCYYNGQFYKPGASFSEGYDPTSDWCYGLYCDERGSVGPWDTWNCKKQSMTTTSPPTTTAPPTEAEPIKLALKCTYNSVHYNEGDTIYEKYDKRNNWCYGLYCSSKGQLIYWDKWNCKELSTPPFRFRQNMVKTDAIPEFPVKGNDAVGCVYKGVEYLSRQIITKNCSNDGRCRVLFCNHRGTVVPKLLRDISRK